MTEPLTEAQARELTEQIVVSISFSWETVIALYQRRGWAALGYPNWDEFCGSEFGNSRLRVPREERQDVVASLREAGLSQRAIASVTGVDQKTVSNDLRGREENSSPDSEPEPVIGTDGKTYKQKPRQPTEEPPHNQPMVEAELINALNTIFTPKRCREYSPKAREYLTEALTTALKNLDNTK